MSEMPKTREESFKILQLPESASEEDVKKAYKQKARELHPDKNPDDPHATRKFQELGEAYQLITSGKCDDEELPDDFFMDPFELFLKVMLIRRMQQEQARRRFAQSFGGLFFEEDDDDVPFAVFGPFGGFTFATRSNNHDQRSSSSRYRKSRAENQRTGNNNRSGTQNRRSGQNPGRRGSSSRNENGARENCSHNSAASEQPCNSEKTAKNETKCSKETAEGKEDVGENFSSGRGSSENGEANFDNKVKGARPKKKTQQTADSWKKGKKGNKGGKKKPPQAGSFDSRPTESTSQFGRNSENIEVNEETCPHEHEDLQEREESSNCSNVQEPHNSNDEPARSKETNSTEDDIGDFTCINTDNYNNSNVIFTDKTSKEEGSRSDTTTVNSNTGSHQDKEREAQPATNQVQATVEQNVSSVAKKLKDISTECATKFEETCGIVNEEKLNQVKKDTCELNGKKVTSTSEAESTKCYTEEVCAESAQNGARPKTKNEQSNTGSGGGKAGSAGRNWQPKKGGKRKKYVNTKFQNLDKIVDDSKVSETVPKESVARSDKSEESHLVSGKGFTWNKKTQEPECKDKTQKKNTKLKDSTKTSQMKNEETEGKLHSSEAPCTKDSAVSDNSCDFSQCKPQEYQKRSVDELYGNMKCKKSKAEARKQNQSGGQYYFGKSSASNTGQSSTDDGQRMTFTNQPYTNRDQIVTNSGNYSQNYYQSNQDCGATRPHASHDKASTRQESYFQPSNIAYNGKFTSSTVIQNIRVENYQSNYQNQNQQDFSVKSEQQRRTNQTKTDSWLQRESRRQQLYNMIPKNEQEEQRQLEIALALSSKQAV